MLINHSILSLFSFLSIIYATSSSSEPCRHIAQSFRKQASLMRLKSCGFAVHNIPMQSLQQPITRLIKILSCNSRIIHQIVNINHCEPNSPIFSLR